MAALAEHAPHWEVSRPHGGISAWARLPTPTRPASRPAGRSNPASASPPAPPSQVDGTFEHHIRLPFTLPPRRSALRSRGSRRWRNDLGSTPREATGGGGGGCWAGFRAPQDVVGAVSVSAAGAGAGASPAGSVSTVNRAPPPGAFSGLHLAVVGGHDPGVRSPGPGRRRPCPALRPPSARQKRSNSASFASSGQARAVVRGPRARRRAPRRARPTSIGVPGGVCHERVAQEGWPAPGGSWCGSPEVRGARYPGAGAGVESRGRGAVSRARRTTGVAGEGALRSRPRGSGSSDPRRGARG